MNTPSRGISPRPKHCAPWNSSLKKKTWLPGSPGKTRAGNRNCDPYPLFCERGRAPNSPARRFVFWHSLANDEKVKSSHSHSKELHMKKWVLLIRIGLLLAATSSVC